MHLELPHELGIAKALHTAIGCANQVDAPLAKELQDCRTQLTEVLSHVLPEKQYTAWMHRLQSAAVQYRDIGHDWGFNEKLLEQYYRANELLVECMAASSGLTNETRRFVEHTMFLPFEQIPDFPS